jgi:hypothetical protein
VNFRENGSFTPKLGGHVLTPFFGKTCQKGKGEAADEKQSVISRLKEEEDGQQDSSMVTGI